MEERKLSWPERGKLWARLGIRLALLVLALWLLQAVGLPLLSLFAPFVAALITAAILHPPIRWLQRRLGVPRKFSTLLILLLLFGLLGAGIGYLGYAGGVELVALVQNWNGLLESLQSTLDQIEIMSAQLWRLVPAQLTAAVESVTQGFMEWLNSAMPDLLNAAVEYTTDKARGVPDVVLALIIYIMACYMLTVDYPYLRSQAVQHTHQRLLHFLNRPGRLWRLSPGGVPAVGGGVLHPAGGLLCHRAALWHPAGGLLCHRAVLRFAPGPGAGRHGLYPHHRGRDGDGPLGGRGCVHGELLPRRPAHGHLGGHCPVPIWGAIALFRRVGEPKFVGDQTGLSPIASLISIYIGWRLAGVLGMILGPTIALIALNLIRLGIFEGVRLDLAAAAEDIMAVLRERPPRKEE